MSKFYFQDYRQPITMGLVIVLASLIVLGFIFNGSFFGFNLGGYGLAHLEINIGNHRRAFEGEIVEGMTVLEAVQASALAGNIIFKYKMDKNNELIVASLDGYDYDGSGKPLNFYINGNKIDPKKIHSTLIGDGDTIVIRSE